MNFDTRRGVYNPLERRAYHIVLDSPSSLTQTRYEMYTHSSSSHRSRSHKFPGLILILSCLTGAILAQTFQYSRGWTNGRKRAGAASTLIAPPSAPASALYQNLDDSNPCSQLQRIRFLLGARNPQQFFFPCDTWRDFPETVDNVSERFKRGTGPAETAQEN